MKKISTKLLMMLVVLTIFFTPVLLAQNSFKLPDNYEIPLPCLDADLVVAAVGINNVSGNSVNFTYVITNKGFRSLYLSRMMFQTYVSKDRFYDNLDKPAGGSILGDNAPVLSNNKSYVRSWTSNSPVDLTEYPYLIVVFKERYNYDMPECNTSNNSYAAYIGCAKTDLDITNLKIISVSSNSVNFTYTIVNKGWEPLDLNKMYLQTYISHDDVLDNLDYPSGGRVLPSNAPILDRNQSYTGTWTANSPINLTSIKTLIIRFHEYFGYDVPDCNFSNNTEEETIFPPIQTNSRKAIDVKISFRQESKSLIIADDDDFSTLTYRIYSLDGKFAGESIQQGSFKGMEELDLSLVKPGLYVVNVTDGSELKTFKFLID